VKLAIASARPSALDPKATVVTRFPPGSEAAFLGGLAADLAGASSSELARLLREGGEDIVILWGERVGAEAAASLLSIARSLGLADRPGAGLLSVPVSANGRGVREAGAAADAGPGYSTVGDFEAGRDADGIARAVIDGSLHALYLLETDPLRDRPDRALWDAALHSASLVIAHASVLTEGLREHANVIFPAESSAEKEGTVVHPDGRVQRLRAAIAHPGTVRAGWSVIASLSREIGHDLDVHTSAMAFKQLVRAVPFYHGLTLDGIGGPGVRWPELAGVASRMPPASESGAPAPARASGAAASHNGASTSDVLRLGTYRPIWAAPEVDISPALQYLRAVQQVELSPEDASRLQLVHGSEADVAQNGTRLRARVAVRTGVPAGTAFLAEGLASGSANVFTERSVMVGKPGAFDPKPAIEDEELVEDGADARGSES
jgi:NADH-quinone oxidoreductase subunit G